MKNPQILFPLIVTDKLTDTRDFYRNKLGWDVRHESKEYLQVRAPGGENSPELCFMHPDQGFPPFSGKGLLISVPTPNADELSERVKKAGAKPLNTPEDRPWGWRSFHLADPNGVLLDFFHVVHENPMLKDATG